MPTRGERREALGTLPPNLEDAFGITVEKIKSQPKPLVNLATTILTWVHLAERPLSIDELLEAYAIREGAHDLDKEYFPSCTTFLGSCLGLVTIEKESLAVRLVHFSLQEYLQKRGAILD
jgi:hypothetical protein